MIPLYYAAALGTGCSIIGFAEWSDLAPIVDGEIPMKPLFCSGAGPLRGFATRRVAHQEMLDLKRRSLGGSAVSLTESQLVGIVRTFCPSVRTLASGTMLAVPIQHVRGSWPALDWADGREILPRGVVSDIVPVLDRLLTASSNTAEDPWSHLFLIGGWVYGAGESKDVDLVMECSPSTALALRRAIALERRNCRRLPEVGFQYRLPLDSCTLDLFPALPSNVPHPLRGVAEWSWLGRRRRIEATVRSAELGSYAWPTLQLVETTDPLVLLSNGFRGALIEGDKVACYATRVSLGYADGSTRNALIVTDPWHDIEDAGRLRSYERDALWTGPRSLND